MPITQRFHYTEGTSNKFWQIAKIQVGKTWMVVTCWGRIGTSGQTRTQPFSTHWGAAAKVDDQAAQKKKKGYSLASSSETNDDWLAVFRGISNPLVKKEEFLNKEVKDIKFPPHWMQKIREELLSGELAIYDHYNDPRTKERRNAISKYYKALIIEKVESEDLQKVHRSAWLMMRRVSLEYLTATSPYKPAAMEVGKASLSILTKKLQELPDSHKAAIDTGLKSVAIVQKKALSLKQMKEGVDKFLEILTREVREKEKVGLGGVSRKRAKRLARRLKVIEKNGD